MDIEELRKFVYKAENGDYDFDGACPDFTARLARSVIAAEKLVEAVGYRNDMTGEMSWGRIIMAITEYKETRK